MQDGVIYGLFNHQGGPRGGDEFVVPNWWMGMWMREKGPHQFGINGMLSLDPATVGSQGYREIFQVGESFEGKPLVDHQHPHDFLMQLSTSWRRSFGATGVMHSPQAQGAGHIIGTARMGDDRATSLVDRDLRSHDHPNLFIVGSAVFPTSATANPTLTIAALSLRAAAPVKASLG